MKSYLNEFFSNKIASLLKSDLAVEQEARIRALEELAETTGKLTDAQFAQEAAQHRNKDLELKVQQQKENDNYLNEQLNQEIGRNAELSDQIVDLREEIQKAQDKIQGSISLSKEREELTGTANGSIQKELR